MKSFFTHHWRVLPPLLIVCALVAEWGCDHSVTPPPIPVKHIPLSVSLFPLTDTIIQGSAFHLTAIISGWTNDSTVSWSITEAGVPPGSGQSQIGCISDTGLRASYAAPAGLIGNSINVRVRVRSNEDTLTYADCIITIVNNGTVRVSVLVNPTAVSIQPGGMQQFQATVSGSSNPGVRWKLVSGSGSLSSNGFYTAPATLFDTSVSAIIEAIALADSTAIGQSKVTVQSPGPCFRTLVQPFFESNCTIMGCHNPTDHIHGLDFTTYEGLMATVVPGDTAKSEIFQRITHVKRPSDAQINTVAQWILSGAPNSQCDDGLANCDTSNIHYSTYVQPTITNYCLGCHSWRFAATCDSLDFNNFATVQYVAQRGLLLGVIAHAAQLPSMPQYGPQLDSCTIAKITAWVRRGAPND